MTPAPIVFRVDVDNTLLDNDRIQHDLQRHLEREFGAVIVDDKPRILAALKKAWGDRVTTVFPRQGQYARDAKAYPPADLTVERIGDLLNHDLSELLSREVTR